MSKTVEQYQAENYSFVGEAQVHSLKAGKKIYGEPVRVDEFTPPQRFEPTLDRDVSQMEKNDGATRLYGTPLTHHAQQMHAIHYGREKLGFDSAPVIFTVNWWYKPASDFLVNLESWQELEPVKELAGF